MCFFLFIFENILYNKNMEIITSKSNSKIIEAKKLLDKKNRDKLGLFLVETEKVLKEALSCGLRPKYFFVEENKTFKFLTEKQTYSFPVFMVAKNVFKEISTVVTPDGIVAVFEKPKQKAEYLGGNFLILDCLQNPDNFGAIMRTAAACNFNQIYTINCVDAYSPKVLRASMGNQFKLNVNCVEYEDISKLFANAKIYVMDMDGKNLFNFDKFDKNTGFVIGNEGNGISKEMKAIVKNSLSIPMKNNVESLNASVSASVVMYYIFSKTI